MNCVSWFESTLCRKYFVNRSESVNYCCSRNSVYSSYHVYLMVHRYDFGLGPQVNRMNDCPVRRKGKAGCMQRHSGTGSPQSCAPCCVSPSSCLLPASAFTVTEAEGEAKRLGIWQLSWLNDAYSVGERDTSVPWHSYEDSVAHLQYFLSHASGRWCWKSRIVQ